MESGVSVIFLDFDGVVRVAPSEPTGWIIEDHRCDFRADKFKLVLDAIKATQSILVISSDWKDFGEELVSDILDTYGLLEYLHNDWATPRLVGHRHQEVAEWLLRHPEVSSYVILEDLRENFRSCSEEMAERIVWTNNRHGLQPEHYGEIITKLKQ